MPKPPKTTEELFDRTFALLPNGLIETDEETGELIIRTGLREGDDGELEAFEEFELDEDDQEDIDDEDDEDEES